MKKLTFLSENILTPLFDEAEQKKIIHLLENKHSIYLNDETFELDAWHNKEQIQLKMSLKKKDESYIYPIEIICAHEEYTIKEKEIAQLIIDYIDLYWSEYFMEDRTLFLPIDWATYECEGIRFYLRGFIRNLSLEKEADSFLQQFGHGEHAIAPISSET